jgi:hypothetical protein
MPRLEKIRQASRIPLSPIKRVARPREDDTNFIAVARLVGDEVSEGGRPAHGHGNAIEPDAPDGVEESRRWSG